MKIREIQKEKEDVKNCEHPADYIQFNYFRSPNDPLPIPDAPWVGWQCCSCHKYLGRRIVIVNGKTRSIR